MYTITLKNALGFPLRVDDIKKESGKYVFDRITREGKALHYELDMDSVETVVQEDDLTVKQYWERKANQVEE